MKLEIMKMNELIKSAKVSGDAKEICGWLEANELTDDQAKELAGFMAEAPYAVMLSCFKGAQSNVKNLVTLHTYVADTLVKRVTTEGASAPAAA